jgi:hypothetical protein
VTKVITHASFLDVDDIIERLLINSEDEEGITKKRALSIFKREEADQDFYVDIKSPKRFLYLWAQSRWGCLSAWPLTFLVLCATRLTSPPTHDVRTRSLPTTLALYVSSACSCCVT